MDILKSIENGQAHLETLRAKNTAAYETLLAEVHPSGQGAALGHSLAAALGKRPMDTLESAHLGHENEMRAALYFEYLKDAFTACRSTGFFDDDLSGSVIASDYLDVAEGTVVTMEVICAHQAPSEFIGHYDAILKAAACLEGEAQYQAELQSKDAAALTSKQSVGEDVPVLI